MCGTVSATSNCLSKKPDVIARSYEVGCHKPSHPEYWQEFEGTSGVLVHRFPVPCALWGPKLVSF